MMMVKTAVRPSPIHGLGCFTLEPIRKGQVVWGITLGWDKLVHEAMVDHSDDLIQDYVRHYGYLSSKDNRWVVPLDDARFMNHSDAPNLANDHGRRDVAARDIAAGEELTCDYRTFDADWQRKLAPTVARINGVPRGTLGEILEDVGHKHGVFDQQDYPEEP